MIATFVVINIPFLFSSSSDYNNQISKLFLSMPICLINSGSRDSHKGRHRAVTNTLHNISIEKLSDPAVVQIFLSKLDDEARTTIRNELIRQDEQSSQHTRIQSTVSRLLSSVHSFLEGKESFIIINDRSFIPSCCS